MVSTRPTGEGGHMTHVDPRLPCGCAARGRGHDSSLPRSPFLFCDGASSEGCVLLFVFPANARRTPPSPRGAPARRGGARGWSCGEACEDGSAVEDARSAESAGRGTG